MVLVTEVTQKLHESDREERLTFDGVTWEEYEALLEEVGDTAGYRITYLDGVLEILSPSRRHETGKSRIGDLLAIYFVETDTPYFPLGSTTFRKQKKRGGTEPDESYCIGTDKEFPDLAIEVIVSSGSVNRLQVYNRLGVREVWFWRNNRFTVYCLRETTPVELIATHGYEQVDRSQVLPNLDLDLLAECLQNPEPLSAMKEFRRRLK